MSDITIDQASAKIGCTPGEILSALGSLEPEHYTEKSGEYLFNKEAVMVLALTISRSHRLAFVKSYKSPTRHLPDFITIDDLND